MRCTLLEQSVDANACGHVIEVQDVGLPGDLPVQGVRGQEAENIFLSDIARVLYTQCYSGRLVEL